MRDATTKSDLRFTESPSLSGAGSGLVHERVMLVPPSFGVSSEWMGKADARAGVMQSHARSVTVARALPRWIPSTRMRPLPTWCPRRTSSTVRAMVGICQGGISPQRPLRLDHLHVRAGQHGLRSRSKVDFEHPNLGFGLKGHQLGRKRQNLAEAAEIGFANDAN